MWILNTKFIIYFSDNNTFVIGPSLNFCFSWQCVILVLFNVYYMYYSLKYTTGEDLRFHLETNEKRNGVFRHCDILMSYYRTKFWPH